MKQIKNILFTILMIGILLIVYTNRDEISSTVKRYLVSSNKPIIKETNKYTRDFKYINFNYDENYVPLNKDDIMNIL